MPTMEIHLNNGKANAHFRDVVVETGPGATSPFELFIASLGTCAALTAAAYANKRNLPVEGMKINMDVERDPISKLATEVKMEFVVSADFPEEEIVKLVRAADTCFVKKHLYNAPKFTSVVSRA